MKKHMLMAAGIFMIGFTACKKDDPSPAPVSPAEGFWMGTYNKTGSPVNEKMAILLKPGGAMRYYEMNLETDTANLPAMAKVSGSWLLSSGQVKISYFANSKTYNATLDINAANTQLTGPWSEGVVVKGTMALSKKMFTY